LNIQGFTVFDYASEFAQAHEEIERWIKERRLRIIKTIYKCAFEDIPYGMEMVFDGKNVGSLVTELIAEG
jgi:NADPH-dependent curcumin reductase CurA